MYRIITACLTERVTALVPAANTNFKSPTSWIREVSVIMCAFKNYIIILLIIFYDVFVVVVAVSLLFLCYCSFATYMHEYLCCLL